MEGLAELRVRQGRLEDAVSLTQRAFELKTPAAAELVRLGEMAMAAGRLIVRDLTRMACVDVRVGKQ